MRAYGQRPAVRDPARERLIVEHMEMGRRIALRVARRTPDWIREEDLVSAAMVGLSEAAERYDAARGEPFVAFAERRIRGAVLDELRRGDLLPRRQRWTARRVGLCIRGLEQRLGRAPDDAEVAAALGVSVEVFHDELQVLANVGFVELTQGAIEHHDTQAERVGIDEQHERRELFALVRAALGRIPERDATILSLYYVEEFNYAEIGDVLGVTESRVCQLHARALARVRAELDSGEAGDQGDLPDAQDAAVARAVAHTPAVERRVARR